MTGFAQTRWERELRDRDALDHFVYLIGRIDGAYELSGPVKIGVSKNPISRMQQLQTASHDRLVLVSRHAFWKRRHAEIVERSAHKALASHNLHGEWFDIAPVAGVAVLTRTIDVFIRQYLKAETTEDHFCAAGYIGVPGFGIDVDGLIYEVPG